MNLDRVKQALWDAFAGTSQPTTLEGLKLYLDEVGWQVETEELEGYEGSENVDVTSEATQAAVYGDLVRRAVCDPDIAQVNIFGFRDDRMRTGFQAGLQRVDGTPRPAAEAVRAAIDGGCGALTPPPWRPTRAVVGSKRPVVRVAARTVAVDLTAAEAAAARVCLLPGAHTLSSARRALASRRLVGARAPPAPCSRTGGRPSGSPGSPGRTRSRCGSAPRRIPVARRPSRALR